MADSGSWQRPRPASSVSSRWSAQSSGSSWAIAAATVICAMIVAPPRPTSPLSSRSTDRPSRAAERSPHTSRPSPPRPPARPCSDASRQLPAFAARRLRRGGRRQLVVRLPPREKLNEPLDHVVVGIACRSPRLRLDSTKTGPLARRTSARTKSRVAIDVAPTGTEQIARSERPEQIDQSQAASDSFSVLIVCGNLYARARLPALPRGARWRA